MYEIYRAANKIYFTVQYRFSRWSISGSIKVDSPWYKVISERPPASPLRKQSHLCCSALKRLLQPPVAAFADCSVLLLCVKCNISRLIWMILLLISHSITSQDEMASLRTCQSSLYIGFGCIDMNTLIVSLLANRVAESHKLLS